LTPAPFNPLKTVSCSSLTAATSPRATQSRAAPFEVPLAFLSSGTGRLSPAYYFTNIATIASR
jgi:hypothetical protein